MGTISTVTIGTDTFSVYALTADPNADATSFHNLRLGVGPAAWLAAVATPDDQNRALVMASDWIDRSMEFTGTKTVAAQDREWPRDGATCGDDTVADGTTPDELAWATFWLAGQILADTSLADGEGTGSNVKSAKAGTAKVEFFSGTDGVRLPTTAWDYVACFADSGSLSGGTATGTDCDSAFSESDYERNQPWA